MNGYLTNPLVFLVKFFFEFYILLIMLRIVFQWFKADFYNPISQFIDKMTSPVLKVMHKFLPTLGRIDSAAVLLLISLQMLEFLIIISLQNTSVSIPIIGLLLYSIGELLDLLINVFIFSIFIQIIISWINPGLYNPVVSILYSITEPIMAPARKLLPPISGMDLSPLLVLIALQILAMLIVPPLQSFLV
ncbi:MAG: YggT family protein [Methylococcales bacterium]|jgi:YggT family protein|nr:YggT family protein [Methylococcales bacterium]MBT7410157.1 YggT family protein [Methylococcales bacterium]